MEHKSTPYIYISLSKIKSNLDYFSKLFEFKKEDIFYPIKVNNDPSIILKLYNEGIGFEAGAISEIQLLVELGIDTSKILFGNPIKSEQSIMDSYRLGVKCYGVDTLSEIKKIGKYAPYSKVYFRLSVSNKGAEWELTDKFGCDANDLSVFINESIKLGLKPIGISFHVGWNNSDTQNWGAVFDKVEKIRTSLSKKGFRFQMINIGGGYPSHVNDGKEVLYSISQVVLPYINHWRQNQVVVWSEPGSFLVAHAGTLFTKIIDKVSRSGKTWLYLNTGVFQGFYWILGGLNYNISVLNHDSKSDKAPFTVCGPTCDTHDVFGHNIMLPSCTSIGDILCIEPAGAYIHTAQYYNGFRYPQQIVE